MKKPRTYKPAEYFMKLLGVALVALAVIAGNAEAQSRKSGNKPKPKKVVRPVSHESKSEIAERVINISAVPLGRSPLRL
ncbi:MAG: hypothetical protein IPG22_23330 [Acidobacteria bacterium]|nr:hypothetical protein [Acidobacteriota bacterium]